MTELKELKSPIRIYWDVGPSPMGREAFHQGICDAIIGNKVLSLSLLEPGDTLSSTCLAVLRYLSPEPVAVTLTISPSALDQHTLKLLRGVKLRKLFIRAASISDRPSITKLFHQTAPALPPGISFEVDRKNFTDLREVLLFCISSGITELVLPMQRLSDGKDCFMMTADERRVLTAELNGINKPGSLKIIIHDPFLWRAFYPAVSFPGKGCQAADTMLYLSPAYDVYPCPSLPIKLGNLLHGSLTEIIGSRKRMEIRQILATSPHACSSCNELVQCMGGCRGRTFKIINSLHDQDPACK